MKKKGKNGNNTGERIITNLIVPLTEAERKIEERIEEGKKLLQSQICSKSELENLENEYSKWDKFNSELFKRLFDTLD